MSQRGPVRVEPGTEEPDPDDVRDMQRELQEDWLERLDPLFPFEEDSHEQEKA